MRTLLIFLILLIPATAKADALNAMQSVCMIHDYGSGVAYKEDKTHIYILTAAHVLLDEKLNLRAEKFWGYFYRNANTSGPFELEIVKYDYNAIVDMTETQVIKDLAILKVKKSLFSEGEQPTIIPLVSKLDVAVNQQILSVGCPGPVPLSYPSMFHGRIRTIKNNGFVFTPNVIGGRSGSAIFDIKGEKIIGIVIWRTTEGGRAISLDGINIHFNTPK
jgi:V8-like Glu-specific endopeptidase